MKRLFFITLILFAILPLKAQVPIGLETSPFFAEADSQKLFFHFSDKNFFKNNEFFNPLNEGYTLIGFIAEPTLVYYPGKTTRLEAGGSFLKYFGRDGFYKPQPILRFQYQPTSYFQMVMGTLYGGINHGLAEPLYSWERNFTEPVENGLQFLFKTNSLKADIWLQWERFIMHNDPFQEELTFGTTFSLKLLPGERSFNLYLPFQALVGHHGGQITSIDSALQTIANYATGLRSTWQINNSFFKQLNVECLYFSYNNLTTDKYQAYNSGYAVYPRLELFLGSFMVNAGYFRGNKFMAPKGEQLFHSATIPFNGTLYPVRDLVTFKLAFSKKIDKGISLAAYAETYTDLKRGFTDYCYGVHIIFDHLFFLHSFR